MAYLIYNDYNRLIQDVSLNQLISGSKVLVSQAELSVKSEIISYLTQKYDTSKEFTDTTVYNPSATYSANSRVYLDATLYDQTKTYALKTLCLNAGKVYQCSTAITVPESFTASHWTLLGNQYDIFYAIQPQSEFNLESSYYNIGDKVFWKNHVYTCIVPSRVYSHDEMVQFSNTVAVPYVNIFPDDKVSGAINWHDEGVYSVPIDKILDTTYFTLGDNRNQQMVMYMIDMVVYHLYRRIPPQVVPKPREDAYKIALMWLKEAAKGDDITADLEVKQPTQGSRIRWSSGIKQSNSW